MSQIIYVDVERGQKKIKVTKKKKKVVAAAKQ